MAVLNALIMGSGGARARVDWGHFRTNTRWSIACFVKLDTLNPGSDGTILEIRRQSNHDPHLTVRFDDSENKIQILQNLGGLNSIGSITTNWLLVALTCDGAQNVTMYVFAVATQTLIGSVTVSTSSTYGHGQPSYVYFGAAFDGSTASNYFDGSTCLMMAVKGVTRTQGDMQNYAGDPLNHGDTLIQTYASSVYFIDDTQVDVGPNGATLTLQSGLAWGSGNGPTVTDRSGAVGTAPSLTALQNKDGLAIDGVIYDGEQFVKIVGTNLGSTGRVEMLDSPESETGEEQVIYSYSATAVVFHCSVTSTGPKSLRLTNLEVGDNFGLDDIIDCVVNPDPGGAVALRFGHAPVNLTTGMNTTIQAARHFYARNAQETLAFSAVGLPTGLSIASSTGIITGTPQEGTYDVEITATDEAGNAAMGTFQWAISDLLPGATTKLPGTWGKAVRRRV